MDNSLVKLMDNYWDNPVWFAEDMLGFHADKWQSDVLMAIASNPKVSVRSGQGVGKTSLESVVLILKENIEMLRRKYQEGSDPWRVRVLGEFPKGESDSLITLEAVETSTIKEVDISNDFTLHIGADIARYGDDETTIAPRIGGKVFDLITYSKKSTMETAGNILRTVTSFKNNHPQVNRVKIKIDDDGLGAGVTDRLREVVYQEGLGYEIIPIQNGSSAIEKENYYNKASEMWDNLREELDTNLSCFIQNKEPSIQLPKDDKLIKQLSSRKYSVDSKGKIQIEPKKEMKKRLGESPDRADAVIYSFAENSNTDLSLLKGGSIWG